MSPIFAALRRIPSALVITAAALVLTASPAYASCTSGTVRQTPILKQGPAGAPLVVVMHGDGGTPALAESSLGWDAYTSQFSIVYAGSLATSTTGGGGWCPADDPANLAYLQQQIPAWASQLGANPARVVATGFSGGGYESFQLACNDAAQLWRVAPVSGSYDWQNPPCDDNPKISELHIFGSDEFGRPAQQYTTGPTGALGYGDLYNIFTGGMSCDAQWVLTSANGVATATSQVCTDPSTGQLKDVGYVEINGGTHEYPGGVGSTGADAQWAATPYIVKFLTDAPWRQP